MNIPLMSLTPSEFLDEADEGGIILDVRAPLEFEDDHMPGATSFPLFDDEERAIVGTIYKQKSKEAAIDKGLEIIGPKMAALARKGRDIFEAQTSRKPLLIHCWRGGMRSQSVAWLLRTSGIPVKLLEGGYKAYRSYARSMYDEPLNLAILGGLTGSAKTDVIGELDAVDGERVLDLEGLAMHFGSAFGNLEGHKQPTSRHFSNLLFAELRKIDAWGSNPRPIWVENESRTIGKVNLPEPFFTQMLNSTCFEMSRTNADRVNHLVNMYGDIDKKLLANAFERISPKLGSQHSKAAIEFLDSDDLASAAEIALVYYDKTYNHGLKKRPNMNRVTVDCRNLSPFECAQHLSEFLTNYLKK